MEISEYFKSPVFNATLFKDAFEYAVDTLERSVIYIDTLRKRGNIYFKHLVEEQPRHDHEVRRAVHAQPGRVDRGSNRETR